MKDLLRRFARYEITVNELPPEYVADPDGGGKAKVEYQITVDDLMAVLDKLEKEKVTIDNYVNEWLTGFDHRILGDVLGLDKAMVLEPSPIPESEEDLFRIIFNDMHRLMLMAGDRIAAELIDIAMLRELKSSYESNKSKPRLAWEFPDEIKKRFIVKVDGMLQANLHCSDDYIGLFARYTEELAAKGNQRARRILGYNLYGGTKAFPCDWNRARDIFEALFEETGDPDYANTLGYIYYYGRCTDGVPEYDKAFRFFSYGAAAGIDESVYKLADMIRQGKSVPKNRDIAFDSIQELYTATRNLFEGEIFNCKFADVALRMGGFFEEKVEYGGVERMCDPMSAYAYYLEAELAIEARMVAVDYYGDDVVAMNINEALERVRPEVQVLDADYLVEEFPSMIEEQIVPGEYLCVSFEKVGDGFKAKAWKASGDKFLITLPEFGYCSLEESIELYATKAKAVIEPEYGKTYMITYIDWCEDDTVTFFGLDKVASFVCDSWIYRFNRPGEEPSDKEYRIATVNFEGSSKGYDYICELDYTNPGDQALVQTSNGTKLVTVVDIRIVKESELPMPVEKYKKLISMVFI